MILFDLKCRSNHTFEAWFRDDATFKAQNRADEITCPVCGRYRPYTENPLKNAGRNPQKSAAAASPFLVYRKHLLYVYHPSILKHSY